MQAFTHDSFGITGHCKLKLLAVSMFEKKTIKLCLTLLLSHSLIGVGSAQSNSESTDAQSSGGADQSLVHNMLERHFYRPDKTAALKGKSADEVLSYLKNSGLDRWAKYHTNTSVENILSQTVRDDFGLRLISHSGAYFLLPEINGPNERAKHTVYRVLRAPEDGDWKSAISNQALSLAPPHEAVRFVRKEYVTTAFKLRESVLRLDNFTNAGIRTSIDRHANKLPNISVLDLRFNGGGRVDLAEQLLQTLFDESVQLGYSLTKGERSYYGEVGNEIPRDRFAGLTVLVSRHTASAAEWVARILQHYGAVVVGERTEGKCLIHNIFPVGNRVYFEFATGYLKTAFESGYDYCNYGLVPNVFTYDIPLIHEGAQRIAALAADCINSSSEKPMDGFDEIGLSDESEDQCSQIFPKVHVHSSGPNTIGSPNPYSPEVDPTASPSIDSE